MSVITPSQFTSKRFGPLEHKRHCHDAVMEYASPTVTAGKTSPGSLDASPSPINERTASLDCASTAGSSDANVNVKSAPKSSGPSDELLLVECPPHKSAEEGERRGKIMTEIINKISNMSQEEQSALQDELERQGCMWINA